MRGKTVIVQLDKLGEFNEEMNLALEPVLEGEMVKILVCYVWSVPGGGLNYSHKFSSVPTLTESDLNFLRHQLSESHLEEGKKQYPYSSGKVEVNVIFTSVIRLD